MKIISNNKSVQLFKNYTHLGFQFANPLTYILLHQIAIEIVFLPVKYAGSLSSGDGVTAMPIFAYAAPCAMHNV